jgi:hypothetical protein
MKKRKTKTFKSKFQFNQNRHDYEVQLKKRNTPRWSGAFLFFLALAVWFVLSNLFTIVTETGYNIGNVIFEDLEVVIVNECDIVPEEEEDNVDSACAKKSLEEFFPPVKSQEEYGTCVCWAVGYNLRTALSAIEYQWTENDLKEVTNQISPKDLWLTIDPNDKGENCYGTYIGCALNVLVKYGAASLANVPYKMKNSCNTSGGTGDTTNKIVKWNLIARNWGTTFGMTAENFKYFLNKNCPIVIGARLGDRFMKWDDSSIISEDRYGKKHQHSLHAMVLSGYDDCIQAFRVRNSWGKDWGDEGSIWVDYNFFLNSFCTDAYVATLHGDDNLEPDLESKTDLMVAYAQNTVQDETRVGELSFAVHNSGNTKILPNPQWTVAIMLYNAKNAKEHYMLLYDFISTRYPDKVRSLTDSALLSNTVRYENIALKTENPVHNSMRTVTYRLPDKLNGKYYIIIAADVEDAVPEENEKNNFWFIAAENGEPLLFENGQLLNEQAKLPIPTDLPELYSNNPFQTPVKPDNLNAYTPGELKSLIQCELKKWREKHLNS